ncbi:MAG: hypothetical protein AB7K68_08800 [Bacteriovoracia bacterium]
MIALLLFLSAFAQAQSSYDPNELLQAARLEATLSCDLDTAPPAAEEPMCQGTFESLCGQEPSRTALTAGDFRKKYFGEAHWQSLQDLSRRILAAGQDRKEKKAALATYTQIVRAVQAQVGAAAAENGIPPGAIKRQLEEVKADFVKRLRAYPQFKNLRYTQKKIAAIQLFDADSLAGAEAEDIEDFYRSCGVDGLMTQAYYNPDLNRVVLCPGYVLENLRPEGVRGMTFLFGHEIGHAADPLEMDTLSTDAQPYSYLARYQNFLSCLTENYKDEFRSIEDAKAKVLGVTKPGLEACELKLKKEGASAEDIFSVRSQLDRLPAAVEEFDAQLKEYHANGKGGDPVFSHSGELAADFMGSEASGNLLWKVSPAERPAIARSQVAFFCQIDETKKKVSDLCGQDASPVAEVGDDGSHPRFRFRIEFFLRNPRIRAALGCTSVSAKPWCSLYGKK